MGPIDLASDQASTLERLCRTISENPNYACKVINFDGRRNLAGNSKGLAPGITALPAGETAVLAWDNRPSSEGGAHFIDELVEPAELISDKIGNGYQVQSFAYPGQKHNESIRQAVEDAGYLIARGNRNHSGANQLMHGEIDLFQSPVSLAIRNARGPGYDALDSSGKEMRIRAFANAWATHACGHADTRA